MVTGFAGGCQWLGVSRIHVSIVAEPRHRVPRHALVDASA
jgi:hypothetical protein